MRGVILAIAPDGTYGQLSADDGQRYSYWTSEVRNGPGQVGQAVDFQMWEGQPVDIFILASAPPSGGAPPAPAPPRGQGAARFGALAQGAASSFPPLDYWIWLFTSVSGRISRRQFWLHGVLPIVVGGVLLGWIPLIGWIISLALTWASICINFKRFHDCGYPGWWSLLIYFPLLLAGVLVVAAIASDGFSGIAWLLAEILWGAAFVVFVMQFLFVYLRAGEQGPNRYGPDPLGAG